MALSVRATNAAGVRSRTQARRPAAVRVVAQAQSMRAAEVQQAQPQQNARSVAVQAASGTWSAAAPDAAAGEQSWLSQLTSFFTPSPQQQQDEEWRLLFGQYINEEEEHGGKHGMFVSHLAERMALEPRSRR